MIRRRRSKRKENLNCLKTLPLSEVRSDSLSRPNLQITHITLFTRKAYVESTCQVRWREKVFRENAWQFVGRAKGLPALVFSNKKKKKKNKEKKFVYENEDNIQNIRDWITAKTALFVFAEFRYLHKRLKFLCRFTS